jgi:hypothetical protein
MIFKSKYIHTNGIILPYLIIEILISHPISLINWSIANFSKGSHRFLFLVD